ncbi:Malic acid transport protein [Wickerhamomyces ciferrii]|uniref:Malic acid transport protein n=1 Tax=Wickerhamomyces ciferrii (strain ATCC 14091 / BCRC 22168 / CBS 111 / JCM 3599 / NBRC 0793 / NRRL Y-1031 F-60-10) TaxID=1206466 RepID=K0KCT9_WICCF|nr:Malic acid transport protein [Wickerhamomyces ciferrii]CCH40706.1 Malic acid transport protein [Wickerhamomyces ciferrii]
MFGQGAYAIQLFGKNFHDSYGFPETSTESIMIGITIKYTCIFVAIFLETFGFFMTFIAIVSVITRSKGLHFHKGWWAMTFPLGTMSISTNLTGKLMNYETFKIISCIYGVCLILITIGCLIGSLIYETPRLKDFEDEVDEVDHEKSGTEVVHDLESGTLYDK